ncbi:uncharacterized protein G2W53_019846 [Senna tora]|uniref:Uncharacterized protein n=1 Tax=Senna tora TaxID=362788 RepID=A0A834WMR4_9FABA|nr:uncharacterized protein G2W53_019846 [Senna tora]
MESGAQFNNPMTWRETIGDEDRAVSEGHFGNSKLLPLQGVQVPRVYAVVCAILKHVSGPFGHMDGFNI